MAAVAGLPADEVALLPSYAAVEWPVVDKLSEIKPIVEEAHTLIMTCAMFIEEMNDRAAALFEYSIYPHSTV